LAFFKTTGRGRQIGGVDQPYRLALHGQTFQKRQQQMPIDLAQDSHTQPGAKLVQAGSSGQFAAIGQVRKTPPGTLLR
jgi:hypothetical protein